MIGAHVSSVGGPQNAVAEAVKIGATAFALFLTPPRRWQCVPLKTDQIEAFKTALIEAELEAKAVLPHGSYLINLASGDSNILEKSRNLFDKELEKCRQLGLQFYNVHPGSNVNRQEGLKILSESIDAYTHHGVTIVVEIMAGQGNTLCRSIDELVELFNLVQNKNGLGFCLDTAHLFGAGYDLRDPTCVDEIIQDFETNIGLQYLKAFHVNDSKVACGTKKDRHECLGQGHIGWSPFGSLVNHKKLKHRDIIWITETPADLTVMTEEIAQLRHFREQ